MIHKKQQRIKHNQQAGFTIIELMIATMVFSVILVVITVGVLYFTRSYYKGVYASSTQNATRDISESVTNAVRFGSGNPTTYDPDTSTQQVFCAGGYMFVFNVGERYDPASNAGMYMQPKPSGDCSTPVAPTSDSRQLLSKGMRVTYLKFTGTDSVYTLVLKVAFGDDESLTPLTTGLDVQCKSGSGSEYCAVVGYTSTAQKRVVE